VIQAHRVYREILEQKDRQDLAALDQQDLREIPDRKV
jgi:hypothetical protein